MTQVVVNDASCLIDLRKGGLLAVLGNLPYRFVIPLPVRESEMLDFSETHWRMLDTAGLVTHDLTPIEVGQAFALSARHPGLSANDCFCHITAEAHAGILLTGDRQLRSVATASGLRVHGVLWIIDELEAAHACSARVLTRALRSWRADGAVFLPRREVDARLVRLSSSVAT